MGLAKSEELAKTETFARQAIERKPIRFQDSNNVAHASSFSVVEVVMGGLSHLFCNLRLPLNVCWFIEKYKRPLVPVPPPHVEVHLDFINCSKEQAEASSQEDEFFAEEEEDSIPSQ